MRGRSWKAAALLYGSLICGAIGASLLLFLGGQSSGTLRNIAETALTGFCVLAGAGALVVWGENDAAPPWVWVIFAALAVAAVLVPPFAQLEGESGWLRLSALLFAVLAYTYKRLFVE